MYIRIDFTTVFLLLTTMFCQAQVAPEWAPIGATWHFNQTNYRPPFEYIVLESVGETILNDTVARVITQTIYRENDSIEVLNPLHLFQDSRKIYFWHHNHFVLTYDFDLEVGDEVKYLAHLPAWASMFREDSIMHFRVDSISEVIINGIKLQRQYLRDQGTGADNFGIHFDGWRTELIGADRFLVPNVYEAECDHECADGLRCYSDSVISFKDFPFPCDTIIPQIVAVQGTERESEIRLFPNPTPDVLKLDGKGLFLIDVGYSIYDVRGVEVFSGWLQYNSDIDVQFLPEGYYYLKVAHREEVYILPFVKS